MIRTFGNKRPQLATRWFIAGFALCGIVVMVMAMLPGCKDRGSTAARWDRIAEGERNELYFINRAAIVRVSDEVVRVSVKYVPSKDQFLISLKEISREFGKEAEEIEPEYTVSTWEFNCAKTMGRCLGLIHFKERTKIASYDYPDPKWAPLDHATSTKVLYNLVCSEASRPVK